MVRIAFVSVPHPSNKRPMPLLFRPVDRLTLYLEGLKHVAGIILYSVIIYRGAFRTTFRPRFDIYVRHAILPYWKV
jgi:hypothetical protein